MSIRRTNRFWVVFLEHILFIYRFVETFYVYMRLAISFARVQISLFLDLQIKSYGCLTFLGKVWAGQACAGVNEVELTKVPKNGGRRR
jgi:hypothetical protein